MANEILIALRSGAYHRKIPIAIFNSVGDSISEIGERTSRNSAIVIVTATGNYPVTVHIDQFDTTYGRTSGNLWGTVQIFLVQIYAIGKVSVKPVSYTHLRAHETDSYL